MLVSQIAGKNWDIKIANRSFDNVSQFKYLGTTLANQNLFWKKIKRRLNSGNACYHSVQNLLCSRLLSKNLKIKIYKTIILPVVLYGCETWLIYGAVMMQWTIFQSSCYSIKGRANTFQSSFLTLHQGIRQCCYLECYVTQQDRAHMDSLHKLCLVFVEQ
jgi:hypothetical protein